MEATRNFVAWKTCRYPPNYIDSVNCPEAVREVVERKLPERNRIIPVPDDEYDDEPAEAETIHSYYSEFLELWHRADEPARAMIRIFVEEKA